MQIRVGFQMVYEFAARTPVMLMLNVHPSRATDMIEPDQLRITPALPVTRYLDAFGNLCSRLVAPAGELTISTDALVADSGLPDPVEPTARAHEIAGISAISALPPSPSRWISAPGSRSISAAAGMRSMPGTTCPASDAS